MKHTKVETSPFFRASCGCIGLDVGRDNWVIIKGCDDSHDHDPYALGAPSRLFVEDKTYTPLTAEETDALLLILGRMVSRGYRLADITRMLGVGVPDPWLEEAHHIMDKLQTKKPNEN